MAAADSSKRSAGQDVDFEELRNLSEQGAKNIIDVREPSELQTDGIIPSAINIPLAQLRDMLQPSSLEQLTRSGLVIPNRDSEIIFTCRSGRRSGLACEMAKELGYTNVRSYTGGILDWNAKNHKTKNEP